LIEKHEKCRQKIFHIDTFDANFKEYQKSHIC